VKLTEAVDDIIARGDGEVDFWGLGKGTKATFAGRVIIGRRLCQRWSEWSGPWFVMWMW
jgi:hypothetical protein